MKTIHHVYTYMHNTYCMCIHGYATTFPWVYPFIQIANSYQFCVCVCVFVCLWEWYLEKEREVERGLNNKYLNKMYKEFVLGGLCPHYSTHHLQVSKTTGLTSPTQGEPTHTAHWHSYLNLNTPHLHNSPGHQGSSHSFIVHCMFWPL